MRHGVRRPGKYLVVLVALLLAVGLLVLFIPSGEPVYGGRRLSDWVQTAYQPQSTGRPEIESAIRNIGANALPYLVRWLRYEPPAWKTRLLAGINRLFNSQLQDRADLRAWGAMEAIPVLGSGAEPAVPALARLMNDVNAPMTANRATIALFGLAHELLAADVALMTNHSVEFRSQAVFMARNFGTRIHAAIPALVRRLQDTNEPIVLDAVQVLREAGLLEPVLIVPTLANSLHDKRRLVRKAAVEALWRLHAQARPAVPALRRSLNDPDPRIRELAAHTLDLIDLEAAEKAVAQ